MTFCATVQAIVAVGATARFVDINLATLCVTDQLVMDAVGHNTAAVIPVLFAVGRSTSAASGRADRAGRVIRRVAHRAVGKPWSDAE
ncbi:DegT/DnrJ/EryC1/StrS family aminotransferase [Streptomyces sp. PSKA30]|uniref:DegT/DnrJ/EryC1/StrS family aminotransferase n=1 Tax=Streptomyces sp. PSKA30 TaxID=2874597 RepID=UPI0027E09278|nr:DegT/DnrJ/EryC1/StrS family aminotransferase [Streptomyces sp. PSKA30]